jgi:DNA polymerase III subunit gamma/tau
VRPRYGRLVAYQSLYRKYRPQRFGELVGQEHVTSALRNAVRDGRTGHAYLFSGPRGTGKTTTARILAKALNCLSLGDDGEPCGVCENCTSITAGTFLDLFELDAASNRGIDNIRGVIESAALGSGPGARTKVYVLDEVHMLTDPAANALLKTLEEAPAHVVFVLATTNPEKVLPTIRSRTQHFEFTLLSMEQLVGRLTELCAREGVEADADTLAVIAAAGAGSARDSESLLDQALAHGPGALDAERVAALFGGSPFALRVGILEAIAGEDAAGALIQLGELLEAGHDPRRVAEDLLAASRDAFLLTAGAGKVRVDAPDDERARLDAVGQTLGNAALVRVIETIGQAVTDMRSTEAADPRLVLEVALVRLSRREAGPPLQTVVERIERLERAMAGGAPAAAPQPTPAAPATVPTSARPPRRTLGAVRAGRAANGEEAPAPDTTPAEAVEAPEPSAPVPSAPAPASAPATELDVDDVIVAWAAILPELPVATRSAVQNAHPLRLDGDVIVFGVAPNVIEAARPRFKKEADAIRAALTHHLGRSLRFNLEPSDAFSLAGGPSGSAPQDASSPPDGADEAPPADSDIGDDIDIDLSQVTDAPPDGMAPTVSLLEQHLGATVVDDVPRELG